MNTCSCCGKQQQKKSGYTWESKFYGTIFIPDVEYLHCECGAEEISSEILKMVEEEEQRLCSKLLLQKLDSIDDINRQYLKNSGLVKMLGITRQAIAKNVLLPRKIYNIVLFGNRYYLRKSVELFLRTGDGRFPLVCKDEDMSQNVNSSTSESWEPKVIFDSFQIDNDFVFKSPVQTFPSLWENYSLLEKTK